MQGIAKQNISAGTWAQQFQVSQRSARAAQSLQLLKKAVWLYYFLLIFEGALRKWFLPGLSTPLLIIRDPVALWVVITAFNRGLLKSNIYIAVMLLIGFTAFFTAIFFGHANVSVALFGLRILIIHFPFMFAVGAIFTAADVEKIGRVTLWIAIPMAVLIGLQFYSPQSAWVNRGVGGDEAGAGFSGAMGFYRPPGTFSFTNGNALFFAFVAAFICYFLVRSDRVNKLLLSLAVGALVISVPFSISRTLIFSIVVCIGFLLIALSRKPKYASRVMVGIIGISALLAGISQLSFFQTATAATLERFTTANETEGGLTGVFADRYLGGMIGAIANSGALPFFGYGLGLGTNVGAMLTTGKLSFLISEGEWGRLIGEMGLLFGLLSILFRISFCWQISVAAFGRLKKDDLLPWMMASYALLVIPQGQWAQPTSLGFSTLAGGLVLAALNREVKL